MKFDKIIKRHEKRSFEKRKLNDQPCIHVQRKRVNTDEEISVITQTGEQVIPRHSIHLWMLLYPVNIGDFIIVQKAENGTHIVECYKVEEITDTEVIGGPCD